MGFNMKRRLSGNLDEKPNLSIRGVNWVNLNGREVILYKGGGNLDTFGVNKSHKGKTISNFNANEVRKLNPNFESLSDNDLYKLWKNLMG